MVIVQTCGKLFKVLTVLLMLPLLTKLCPTMGRTTTDIKSKANAFINHYARVSKLNMLQSDSDTNQQFKKRLKAPSIENVICVPLLMGELQSAIKRQKVKDQLTLTMFYLYFSSHSILWPSMSYYPYLTNHSHLLTAHESGGLPL